MNVTATHVDSILMIYLNAQTAAGPVVTCTQLVSTAVIVKKEAKLGLSNK